ncbi:MAG: hypothetical protein IPN71_07205 [Fibrobacteres bacterium]|nr:hypothetical protein [Fibrobacterota bacterium]
MDGSNAARTRSLVPPWRIQGRAALQRLAESILSDDRGRHPRTHRRVLGIRDLERRFGSEILETACSKMTPPPRQAGIASGSCVSWCRRNDARTRPTHRLADSTMTDPVIRSMDEYQEMIDALMGEVGQ